MGWKWAPVPVARGDGAAPTCRGRDGAPVPAGDPASGAVGTGQRRALDVGGERRGVRGGIGGGGRHRDQRRILVGDSPGRHPVRGRRGLGPLRVPGVWDHNGLGIADMTGQRLDDGGARLRRHSEAWATGIPEL